MSNNSEERDNLGQYLMGNEAPKNGDFSLELAKKPSSAIRKIVELAKRALVVISLTATTSCGVDEFQNDEDQNEEIDSGVEQNESSRTLPLFVDYNEEYVSIHGLTEEPVTVSVTMYDGYTEPIFKEEFSCDEKCEEIYTRVDGATKAIIIFEMKDKVLAQEIDFMNMPAIPPKPEF